MNVVPEHDQSFTHTYIVHYPSHYPRETDPFYRTFEEYRRKTKDTAQCQFGLDRGGDFSECDLTTPLELHHAHIEFAMMNAITYALLEPYYPGISTPTALGQWIESAKNLLYLCRWHHRGHGGVHCATQSDFEASHFIRKLLS